jgi:hypothetical protein
VRKIVILSLILLAAMFWALHSAGLLAVAAEDQVGIFFNPGGADLPPNRTLSLMVDAKSYNLVGANIELSFDATKLFLTDEISTTNSPLKTIIRKTELSEANSTGRIVIALGSNFGDSPSSGLFEIAQLSIGSASCEVNQIVYLSVIDENVQLVDDQIKELPFTSQPVTLTLNPVPGDVNGDKVVNVLDIIEIVKVYQTSPPENPYADLNCDDTVNVLDIIKVVNNYPK